MLLAEQFLLTAIDPLHGTVQPSRAMSHRPRLLAVALLMELAICREIKRDNGGLRLDHDLPSFHIMVDQTRAAMKRAGRALRPAEAIDLTLRQIGHIRSELLQGMVERGILHADGGRRFWLFGERRYPLRSLQAQQESIRYLEHAADGGENGLRAAAATILATRSGLATVLLHAPVANRLHARLKELQNEAAANDKDDPDAESIAVMLALGDELA